MENETGLFWSGRLRQYKSRGRRRDGPRFPSWVPIVMPCCHLVRYILRTWSVTPPRTTCPTRFSAAASSLCRLSDEEPGVDDFFRQSTTEEFFPPIVLLPLLFDLGPFVSSISFPCNNVLSRCSSGREGRQCRCDPVGFEPFFRLSTTTIIITTTDLTPCPSAPNQASIYMGKRTMGSCQLQWMSRIKMADF